MEQYTINKPDWSPSVIEGKFFHRIYQKHIEAYGEKGAKNIFELPGSFASQYSFVRVLFLYSSNLQ